MGKGGCGGGKETGSELSLVSDAAVAHWSQKLRDVLWSDREGILTRLSSLRHQVESIVQMLIMIL